MIQDCHHVCIGGINAGSQVMNNGMGRRHAVLTDCSIETIGAFFKIADVITGTEIPRLLSALFDQVICSHAGAFQIIDLNAVCLDSSPMA